MATAAVGSDLNSLSSRRSRKIAKVRSLKADCSMPTVNAALSRAASRKTGLSLSGTREKNQAATGMVYFSKVFSEVTADLGRGIQTRENINKAKQCHAQRFIV